MFKVFTYSSLVKCNFPCSFAAVVRISTDTVHRVVPCDSRAACFLVLTVARPHELPAPFDGQRQYSHQVHTALTTSDGRALTPGSGEYDISWFHRHSVGLITDIICNMGRIKPGWLSVRRSKQKSCKFHTHRVGPWSSKNRSDLFPV